MIIYSWNGRYEQTHHMTPVSFLFCLLSGRKSLESYDPLHRNPLYCGADHTTLWELQRVRNTHKDE